MEGVLKHRMVVLLMIGAKIHPSRQQRLTFRANYHFLLETRKDNRIGQLGCCLILFAIVNINIAEAIPGKLDGNFPVLPTSIGITLSYFCRNLADKELAQEGDRPRVSLKILIGEPATCTQENQEYQPGEAASPPTRPSILVVRAIPLILAIGVIRLKHAVIPSHPRGMFYAVYHDSSISKTNLRLARQPLDLESTPGYILYEMETELTIKQVAQQTGLSIDTLRYYERIGLLEPIGRAKNGHRRYTQHDIGWIDVLIHLRDTGMPRTQMVRFAQLRRQGSVTATERRIMLEQHQHFLEQRMQELEQHMAALQQKIARIKGIEALRDAASRSQE